MTGDSSAAEVLAMQSRAGSIDVLQRFESDGGGPVRCGITSALFAGLEAALRCARVHRLFASTRL